ncbi:energy-coupling factor transporter transmembrane component T family protein [Sulfitobacter donghicola]|uniref:ABC transporter permease n=1 Tax=Sulfitobacter donghicola DSW-25 = KCTC 12864 = JCM 14565 TaxID=1300350 RepID=A0A073IN54_9RHOB|nr:energy-coupling factor transporter transmembrane protein EcfT [Sulfitobacter donghicola]KEJ90921.1 ABC transporter permease [Sulfitobacter donghicola DSW-25 = KCTC 12864 = JCM 14565]KIN68208.1 putative ABC transporter, inner membrane subunit [Sulfitobacter donghicola DSW-25 = KCTC 12864 = JCM 14565]
MISLTSPVKTRAHGWPAGAKLLGLCVASVGLFSAPYLWVQMAAAATTLLLYSLPGQVFLRFGLRRLLPLWPFVVLVLVWHVATSAAYLGAVITLRMLTAVALANLVTMTTSLEAMMDVFRRILRPFSRMGLNFRAIELAAAMVIRFTPVLAEKGAALTLAWRARARRRAGWRVIVPFMVLALDDADHVADALRARGGFDTDKERH